MGQWTSVMKRSICYYSLIFWSVVLMLFTHSATALCEDVALGIENKTIPDGQLTSSSFNVSTPAKNARLNFVGLPWCAVESSTPLYLQVDLGSLHAVCAVATQGNYKADQWVETYQLKMSTDGKTWTDYEEGGQVRDFQGNGDRNTAVKQILFEGVVSRYVRFVPKTCNGFCCLRVELYGAPDTSCRTTPVGIADRSKIPNHRMTATTYYARDNADKRYMPYQGRFSVTSCAWEAKKASTGKDYLQVDLGGVHFICALATKGNGCPPQEWTKKYKIYLSLDNKSWSIYKENGVDKIFTGNTDKTTINTNQVSSLPRAKFIRFWPTDVKTWAVLRVEIYGAVQACRSSLGMEDNSITDSQITAQPNTNTPSNGRLYNTSTWCSSDTKAGYLQVDLGQVKTVTGVATQGHHSSEKWVKTYKISYKYDTSLSASWQDYKLKDSGPVMTFDGNENKNEVRVNWLPVPVVARYIRVIADSWMPSSSGPCLRIDLYGCDYVLLPVMTLTRKALAQGGFVDVVCNVTSQSQLVMQWWLGDTDVTSLSSGVIRSDDSLSGVSVSTLRVNFTSVDDIAAKYNCTRESSSSRVVACTVALSCSAFYAGIKSETIVTRSAAVVVTLVVPQFTERPKDRVMIEGQNVTFPCKVSGVPEPSVVWNFSGGSLPRHSIKKWDLTLFGVKNTERFEGRYTCAASSRAGFSSAVASLVVDALPKVLSPLQDVYIKVGERLQLTCNTSADPEATISWTKDNSWLSQRVTYENKNSTLIIDSAVFNDDGKYTCVATNRHGNVSSSATVEVQDKPKPDVCPKQSKDGVDWSSTNQGSLDVKPCPAPANGKVVRACLKRSGDAVWGATNFVNCTAKQYVDLGKEARALVEGFQTNRSAPEILEALTNITEPSQNNEGKPDEVYGGDIKISVQILEYLAEFNSGKGNGSLSNPGNQKKFLLAASNLLEETNMKTWRQLDEEDNGFSTILVDTLDNYGLSVAGSLDGEGNKSYALIETPNIVMRMDNVGHNNQIKTDGLLFAHEKSKIFLPPEVFRSTDSNRVASFIYLTLHEILSFNKFDMAGGRRLSVFPNSSIVSSTVDPSPPRQLRTPVKIVLEKKEDQSSNDTTPPRSCVFWRVGLPRTWHTDGCRLVASTSDDVITCECYHLTMFASLMDPYGESGRAKIPRDLEIISLVGCIISTVAVLLTVGVTLFLWRFTKKPRTQIVVLLNLCAAIAITCALVIGESWARDYEAICTVVAALLHYSLLAMFSWMLCEGILLYIAVMKMTVGGAQETPKYFYAIGWGFPAIVVAVSLGATQTAGYGTADICWLSIDSGLIWAFIGPASVVILVNIVIFILVLRQTASIKAVRNKDRMDKIRSGVWASVVILPILGLTWVFGLLGFNVDTLAFKYIFTILNSLQGLLIFIFHCVLNKKTHDAIKRWVDKRNKIKDQRLAIGIKRRRRDNYELKMEPAGEENAAVSRTKLSQVIQEQKHSKDGHLCLIHREHSPNHCIN